MLTRAMRGVVAILACLFLAGPALGQDEVVVSAKASKAAVVPGDQIALAVIFQHEEGWHIHTNDPVAPPGLGITPIPTEISITVPDGVAQWPIQWPKPHEARVRGASGPVMYGVFDGRAIAYIPVRIPDNANPGDTVRFEIVASFQACDETKCLLPDFAELTIELPVITLEAAASARTATPDLDFADFDGLVFGAKPLGPVVKTAAKPVNFDVFGWQFQINPSGVGVLLMLLIAGVGGFILNFTPCVLPVLPLKIMGISAAAGNPARSLYLGTIVALGVVAFWMVIGGAIAFVSGFTAISSLFQTPWFSLGVGLFILFMAAGMLGAYAVKLPKAVYLINPSHETAYGSFVFGVMAAVLATPCIAPVMGTAAAWAATQTSALTLTLFAAIGAGMALPYLVLSASPKLLSRVPRTGPASELIKQVMGLLLVAIAIFFLGTGVDPMLREPVDPPVRFFWWIVGAVAVGAMLWLVYQTYRITRRPVARVFWTGFAAIFGGVSILVAIHLTDRGPIPWVGYLPERLDRALAENKIVVMDFTAEWCLTCKVQEAAVLYRPEIVALLKHEDVIPMKVDLTGNNLPGKQKLKELERVGIPLLAIFGPTLDEPIKYDAYTVDMVKEAIARAGGPTGPDEPARAAAAPAPVR